jgi:hypothetical protein
MIAPNGRIFIYGGFNGNESKIQPVGSYPSFAVLEFVNNEFVWSTPDLFGRTNNFRIYHTSHVYKNYLITTFGTSVCYFLCYLHITQY